MPARALRGDARSSTSRADQFLESAHSRGDARHRRTMARGRARLPGLGGFPENRRLRAADLLLPLRASATRSVRRASAGALRCREHRAGVEHRIYAASPHDDSRVSSDAGRAAAGGRPPGSQRGLLLAEIRSRRAARAPLAGSVAWRAERASTCDWREEFDTATRLWLTAAAGLHLPRRILLAGDPPADDSVHRAIESAGGTVVLELTESDPRCDVGATRDHRRARRSLSLAAQSRARDARQRPMGGRAGAPGSAWTPWCSG